MRQTAQNLCIIGFVRLIDDKTPIIFHLAYYNLIWMGKYVKRKE